MCTIGGKLEIYVDDDRGYLKGKAGKSWYLPPSGSERLRQWLRSNQGKIVNLETVRGMAVKIISIE